MRCIPIWVIWVCLKKGKPPNWWLSFGFPLNPPKTRQTYSPGESRDLKQRFSGLELGAVLAGGHWPKPRVEIILRQRAASAFQYGKLPRNTGEPTNGLRPPGVSLKTTHRGYTLLRKLSHSGIFCSHEFIHNPLSPNPKSWQ